MPVSVKKKIGEREFTFSPINMGVVRKLHLLEDFRVASHIKSDVPSEAEVEAMLRILHGSATVAEPELTYEDFCTQGFDQLAFIDAVKEMSTVLPVVFNASGLVKREGGESSLGEAPGSQS